MGGSSGRPPPFFFCPCKSELSFWQIVCEFGSLHVRDRPCAFGKRPRRSKNPSSRKLPALSRFFLFPNSTNYCHGCCHELPDHDRISLTTEPVQALSIVRVAHCWKRCPRLPLPRLQDPLRPGQIRGSCAEDRTCLGRVPNRGVSWPSPENRRHPCEVNLSLRPPSGQWRSL